MEANKVLLIFETQAPSAFIIETGEGGEGLGAASRKTPKSQAHVAGAGTRASGRLLIA